MITPARPEPLAAAENLRLHVGGAESNVACHAAALGVTSAWVSAVGADVLGELVYAEVAGRGVNMRWVRTDPAAQTGVYFKDPGNGVLYYRRESAASRLEPADVLDVPFEEADVVHVSGITPALSSTCADLVDTVLERTHRGAAQMSFDVNYRAPLWARGDAAPALLALARRSDIVFVGLDEAEKVWGLRTPSDIRALLPEPTRLVVKDGDVGVTEFARIADVETKTFAPAIPVRVVEPVGAGDAFAAGYLVALIEGADSMTRLVAGHARAHLVLQSTSDFVQEPSR